MRTNWGRGSIARPPQTGTSKGVRASVGAPIWSALPWRLRQLSMGILSTFGKKSATKRLREVSHHEEIYPGNRNRGAYGSRQCRYRHDYSQAVSEVHQAQWLWPQSV